MIKQQEFSRRRQRLMQEVGEGALIIVAAAPHKLRNGDTFYPYRQDSDFLYLTGFCEPEALLVLRPGQAGARQVLFLREPNPERERLDGKPPGPAGGRTPLDGDHAFPHRGPDGLLPAMLEYRRRVYHLVGKHADMDARLLGWLKQLDDRQPEIVPLEPVLHEQRLIKSHDEIRCMRRAAKISAAAITRAMQTCRPGMTEAGLTAELVHEYTRNGCPPAYLPIVAGGQNACILHYVDNNQPLPGDGLVLIDAGCEHLGYAADISRTFPVNGRFSAPQLALYHIVLEAHRAAIEHVRAGRPLAAIHDAATRILTRGLIDRGLLDGSLDENLENGRYLRFNIHKTGHWRGLDTHDVGDYRIEGQSRVLEKNMVVTVEPGLYIDDGEDRKSVG